MALMFKIPLQYSFHTLDGKELVPAGTVLTEDVIREGYCIKRQPGIKEHVFDAIRFGKR